MCLDAAMAHTPGSSEPRFNKNREEGRGGEVAWFLFLFPYGGRGLPPPSRVLGWFINPGWPGHGAFVSPIMTHALGVREPTLALLVACYWVCIESRLDGEATPCYV